MSERLSFYQLFAEKDFSIEIPIIQRDYAQGRSSVKEVRDNFLDSLKKYLDEDIPFRDLDFVYGDLDNGKLLPLDGQQRLTTLFLLHWYLAVSEQRLSEFRNIIYRDDVSRFSYKTRQSASDFCDALLLHAIGLNDLLPADEDNGEIAATIKDSDWYFLSWNNDPTISSMLVMLDAIHLKFQNQSGMYEKLTDLALPIITFQFLPLSNYGLTDDLYIKMNSRGKPLSRFENFKAKFEQHLSVLNNSPKYELTTGDHKRNVGIKQYFEQKIDTDWADLFWHYKGVNKDVYDSQIMNFISVIAINHFALSNLSVKARIDQQQKLPFSFYTQLSEAFSTVLITIFDLLSIESTYKEYLRDFGRYNEIESFKEIIDNTISESGYPERLKFFAYYSFLAEWNGNEAGFSDWMRVVVNLVESTVPYNNDTEFINSIRAINRILSKSNSIIDYFSGNPKLSGFNPVQIREEIIKAHLIQKGKEWSDEIYSAESHPYFKGQLISSLAFSGIEDYFEEHSNCAWDEHLNTDYLLKFKSYNDKIFALFDKDGLIKDAKTNHLLHRAVLHKGDYLVTAKSNYSFLNDKGRDISWKRFLQGDGDRSRKRKFLKMVLDDTLFDHQNISSLRLLFDPIDPALNDWRKHFIEQPELFHFFGPDKYIRFTSPDAIDLLKGVKLSGEHVELRTYSMFLKGAKRIACSPFTEITNHPVSGDTYRPHIRLNNWHFSGDVFYLIVFHKSSDKYGLKFGRNGVGDSLPLEIGKELEKNGFELKEDSYQKTVAEKVLIEGIELLCKSLNAIQQS